LKVGAQIVIGKGKFKLGVDLSGKKYKNKRQKAGLWDSHSRYFFYKLDTKIDKSFVLSA
jgi:hypothetical protein